MNAATQMREALAKVPAEERFHMICNHLERAIFKLQDATNSEALDEVARARNIADGTYFVQQEAIKQMEAEGRLDPKCEGCREFYEYPGMPSEVFAPRHLASPGCESGGHPHCSCDRCF